MMTFSDIHGVYFLSSILSRIMRIQELAFHQFVNVKLIKRIEVGSRDSMIIVIMRLLIMNAI